MAKIEVTGTPEELDRIATFLQNNNLRFKVVRNFGNHSIKDGVDFDRLIRKYTLDK